MESTIDPAGRITILWTESAGPQGCRLWRASLSSRGSAWRGSEPVLIASGFIESPHFVTLEGDPTIAYILDGRIQLHFLSPRSAESTIPLVLTSDSEVLLSMATASTDSATLFCALGKKRWTAWDSGHELHAFAYEWRGGSLSRTILGPVGSTWSEPPDPLIAREPVGWSVYFAVPRLITDTLVFNDRPATRGRTRLSIAMARRSDDQATWSLPSIVAEADTSGRGWPTNAERTFISETTPPIVMLAATSAWVGVVDDSAVTVHPKRVGEGPMFGEAAKAALVPARKNTALALVTEADFSTALDPSGQVGALAWLLNLGGMKRRTRGAELAPSGSGDSVHITREPFDVIPSSEEAIAFTACSAEDRTIVIWFRRPDAFREMAVSLRELNWSTD